MATTLLVTKPPTPYRYAFVAGSITFLFSRAVAVLFASMITGDILVDVLTGLVLNLLAFGLVAPLLAFSKPVERFWQRVLRRRNAHNDFPDRPPLRRKRERYRRADAGEHKVIPQRGHLSLNAPGTPIRLQTTCQRRLEGTAERAPPAE